MTTVVEEEEEEEDDEVVVVVAVSMMEMMREGCMLHLHDGMRSRGVGVGASGCRRPGQET